MSSTEPETHFEAQALVYPVTAPAELQTDATFGSNLAITFGTQDNYEAFRTRVRADDKLVSLGSAKLSDWWTVKFFDGARGNGELAYKMLEKTMQWRIDYKWDSLATEDFTADEQTGKLYFHNFAKDGTPVLIWRIARHKADPKLVEHTVRFIVYTMVKGIRDGTIASRLTLLVDRLGSTNDNVEGIAFFRSLTSVLQTHFPEMLQRIIIFPTNWLLWTVWKVVKPFLDMTVVERVSLVGPKEYKQTLKDAIALESLSQRYGGNSVDWTDKGAVAAPLHDEDDEDDGSTEEGAIAKMHERDSAVSVSAVSLQALSLQDKKDGESAAKKVPKSSTWGVSGFKKMSFKKDFFQSKEK
ncbi:hypothetical protein HDU86_005482 [Geranomyces michiganensis]|nr:hypothetical protein HDU86_005482 [Geranomyces michiganensis]